MPKKQKQQQQPEPAQPSLLADKPESGESYVQPNYIETQLSKDKRQECREIVKTINDYGVSQRQKLFLIWLLALELENRTLLTGITAAVGASQHEVEAPPKKPRIVVGSPEANAGPVPPAKPGSKKSGLILG